VERLKCWTAELKFYCCNEVVLPDLGVSKVKGGQHAPQGSHIPRQGITPAEKGRGTAVPDGGYRPCFFLAGRVVICRMSGWFGVSVEVRYTMDLPL